MKRKRDYTYFAVGVMLLSLVALGYFLTLAGCGTKSDPVGRVDVTPPNVSFADIYAGEVIVPGVRRVTLAVNAGRNETFTTTLTGGFFSTITPTDDPLVYEWDSTNDFPGHLDLHATATDSAGNVGTAVVSFDLIPVVESNQPNVLILSPADNDMVRKIVVVMVAATDDYSVDHCELYVDGINSSPVDVSWLPPWTLAWNTRGVAVGPHTLRAMAWDECHNPGISEQVTVQVRR